MNYLNSKNEVIVYSRFVKFFYTEIKDKRGGFRYNVFGVPITQKSSANWSEIFIEFFNSPKECKAFIEWFCSINGDKITNKENFYKYLKQVDKSGQI